MGHRSGGSPQGPVASRARVLELIRAGGAASRTELAQRTGLTRTTISNVVRELLADGLIREAGTGPWTGGKRRTLLEVAPNARFAVGISIDIEAATAVVTDLQGRALAHARRPGAGGEPAELIVERVVTGVRQLVAETGVSWDAIVGVGVAAPGPVDLVGGRAVQLPSGQPWWDFALRERIEEAFGVTVQLDNNATAAAIGELWSGAHGDSRAFAVMYLDAGIGLGIVIDGHPVRGSSANAGEIGHLSIDRAGEPCHCGNRGCLERYAAPFRMEQRYLEETGRPLTAPQLGQAALQGDRLAEALFAQAAEAMAVAAVGVANILDLEVIVLAGSGFGPALGLLVPAMQDRLDAAFFARRRHPVLVQVSDHPETAAAVGAASMVLRRELASR